MIHHLADVKSPAIGAGATIMQFSVVDATAVVGPGSVVGTHCVLGPDVVLGSGVRLEAGVHFARSVDVADHVVVGPNVTLSVSGLDPAAPALRTTIAQNVRIGAGAVLYPGITVGPFAEIAPGAVVQHSVPAAAVVAGNPARIVGYVDAGHHQPEAPATGIVDLQKPVAETGVKGVTLHRMPLINDIRGSLTVGEFERTVPFPVRRYFVVFDVPSAETRGEHAHRQCAEFLVCIKGHCSVVADDGERREEFLLDRPQIGLLLPPMVWRVHYKYSPEAVLMVFASHYYDPADYIRDYMQFIAEVKGQS